MIGNIEQAIVDLISEASKSEKLGYEIGKIASYKSELSEVQSFVANNRTAVLIAYGGKRVKRKYGYGKLYEARFLLYIMSRNSTRNEVVSRQGLKNKDIIGAYQLLEDIENLLEDEDLGILAEPLELVDDNPLFNMKVSIHHAAMYEAEFTCSFEISSNCDEEYEDLPKFERLATNWDVPNLEHKTILNLEQGEENEQE